MKLPRVALVLYPNFSLFHFTIPFTVFSMELEHNKLFELMIVATEESENSDSSKLFNVKADGGLSLLQQADLIVMFGWDDITQAPSKSLQLALQQAYQRGSTIVGLCYGAYPLAYAGLLDGKKATTHWYAEQDFKQRFPQIQLETNAIYIEQERIMTSAGTASGLDCCLAIVRSYYGVKVANQIARILVVSPHREGGQSQFIEQPIARKTANENINQLLEVIRSNLTETYSIDMLAKRLLMSRSTFTRHFRKATGMAYNEWLIEIRLQRARELLESTKLTIEEISQQVGFHSATSFRQHFKQKHQISPKKWQQRFTY
ncbi:AraC family transcriptional regulator [Gallibacterium salpingitidis]|uniref:AraC family transcriptional regulator n=1 Tax=Gallibacterium salpingitidis TaxID=505341 RepID=A0AB36E098_9PAST|nr:helix-turn-helix domain-containing protein [Gallibacterium salpingitidis]OBX07668.1 AraC family transcriptional regulator [Gallibacterium salpingitidis]